MSDTDKERAVADADEIEARNAKVAEVQTKICQVARLSPHGSHGIDFFDSIMCVYLFGRDAGEKAGRKAGIEDAANISLKITEMASGYAGASRKNLVERLQSINGLAASIRKLGEK